MKKYTRKYYTKQAQIRKENLLKNLFLAEKEAKPFPLFSADDKILIKELEKEGWIKKENGEIRLTEDGKKKAAEIVRKHRLYETFLAQKTGFDPALWHRLAEKEEHLIDAETLEKWERELGNPLLDPHGDPIPDTEGALETLPSVLLSEEHPAHWTVYKVMHIEDEPEEDYLPLLRLGMYPGMIFRARYRNGRWEVEFEGLKTVLPPAQAALLSVIPADPAWWDGRIVRLSLLRPGEKAEIIRLSDDLQGLVRQRLLDLGFVPGTEVRVYLRAPAGEPTAYDVKGATIALRKEQAGKILVKL